MKDKNSAIRIFLSDKVGISGGFVVAFIVFVFIFNVNNYQQNQKIFNLNNYQNHERFDKLSELSRTRNPNCSIFDCFNVYRCGSHQNKISIYIYPLTEYSDDKKSTFITKEFYQILKAIIKSPYYVSNPNEACLFVPSIDLLNQNLIDKSLVEKALASLEHWDNGRNHILFNMLPGEAPDYSTVFDVKSADAIIAGAGFDTDTYRYGFDFSIPFYSILLNGYEKRTKRNSDSTANKKYFLISPQLNMYDYHRRLMQEIVLEDSNNNILLLQKCTQEVFEDKFSSAPELIDHDIRCSFPALTPVEYPDILEHGTFCLIIRGVRLAQPSLLEALATNCIPVIVADNIVLPFAEILDWTFFSISLREADLHSIVSVLKAVSQTRIEELQRQGKFIYEKYFKDIETIVHSMLEELNDRVFPHLSLTYNDWNLENLPDSARNPLFLPLMGSKSQGFTAVILTYDRIESLFTLIQKLSLVPSLQKILVIWNNQKKQPPPMTSFPKIAKPLKLIQTKANKLSNRFYPYPEIETEAVLTIDDDITMLTADELDFAFEVWREFPDRIVGFPSRTHVFENNEYRYESEWTNEISMVLTGVAFHHKYWNYAYTTSMPGNIKEYVDEHMNCEDIAMNFLVSNRTGKAPIKVTPRKKFKCYTRDCANADMLSSDTSHMVERSDCINVFTKIYGRIPLKTVEFRADPVLFRDNFPEKLKRFNDVGSL